MLTESTMQISLTVFHGQLIGIFLYDYIIRNTVILVNYGRDWNTFLLVALGKLNAL